MVTGARNLVGRVTALRVWAMTSLTTLIPDPESRACVEALYGANPDGTADLMLAFPEAVFSWGPVEHEGSNPRKQRGSGVGPVEHESYRQGRLM